jgi:hypothetical protein
LNWVAAFLLALGLTFLTSGFDLFGFCEVDAGSSAGDGPKRGRLLGRGAGASFVPYIPPTENTLASN